MRMTVESDLRRIREQVPHQEYWLLSLPQSKLSNVRRHQPDEFVYQSAYRGKASTHILISGDIEFRSHGFSCQRAQATISNGFVTTTFSSYDRTSIRITPFDFVITIEGSNRTPPKLLATSSF